MHIKSFNQYHPTPTDIPGADITLDDFDCFEGDYPFSEEYRERKKKFLNSLDDMPKASLFRCKPYQIAAAILLVLIVVPTTAYAAVHYYNMYIQKNNYQTDIVITPGTDITASSDSERSLSESDSLTEMPNGDITFKPVKMKLNYLPAGSRLIAENDEKYYVPSDNDPDAHSVSPFLNKLDYDQDMVFNNLYAISSLEFTAGDNPAYLIKKASGMSYDKIIYVLFEKEHYLAGAYLGYDISEKEAKKIAEGIVLEESDWENATVAASYAETVQNSKQDQMKTDTISAKEKIPSRYHKTGEKLPVSDFFPNCEITVKQVDFFNSINDFDLQYFFSYTELDKFADASGALKQHERNEWNHGDGITTLDTLVDTQTVGRKFVYVTLDITNTSDIDENDYPVSNQLMFMKETASGKLELKENVYNYDSLDTEPVYFDSSLTENTDTHFFYTKIPAGETVTCHLGYFVDDDLTDSIFFHAYCGNSYGTEDSDYSLTDIREK